MSVVLILVVAVPLLGAAMLLLPGIADRAARLVGVGVSAATLIGAVVLACGFDRGRGMQFETDVSWAPSLGLRFHLGIDGISLPLLLLTALLTLLVAVHSLWNIPPGGDSRAFVALFLLLETGTLGTFAALDLILFFLFFEVVLVPMYFLINRWGSPGERGPASYKFILYTLLGSAVMLLGFLLIQAKTGTFDMVELADRHGVGMSHGVQVLAFLAIGLGLAVKVPMWPLHTWLPDAHTAAPTAGSVLLAGVLLKMGTYGLIRIAVPMLPEGAETFAPYLAAFGVVGIVYGSLVCLALLRDPDGDLKRIIAYSSVGHMGFALLGIATLTPQGINGALFVNIGHGLVTGLLFFLAGAVKDRHGTALLGRLGSGMYGRTPRLGALVAFGAVAGLGLPGLAGFWGELLAMYGAYEPAAGLSTGGYRTFLVLAGLGTVLTAAYMLGLVRRLCMGPAGEAPTGRPEVDVTGREVVVWTPLVALTLLAGLWPATVLAITDPAVRALMGGS
ncbi:NADH-quinone oxidoreductase subunit M [Embleya sp. NPDC005575]|uniref:complex I subunit 4 family protein n=1 Tax=Embleya sp. NPDC005575 TaxID=3156892 RepID=UPI0033BE7FCF